MCIARFDSTHMNVMLQTMSSVLPRPRDVIDPKACSKPLITPLPSLPTAARLRVRYNSFVIDGKAIEYVVGAMLVHGFGFTGYDGEA